MASCVAYVGVDPRINEEGTLKFVECGEAGSTEYLPVVIMASDKRTVFMRRGDTGRLLAGPVHDGVALNANSCFSLPVLHGRVAVELSVDRWAQVACTQREADEPNKERHLLLEVGGPQTQ